MGVIADQMREAAKTLGAEEEFEEYLEQEAENEKIREEAADQIKQKQQEYDVKLRRARGVVIGILGTTVLALAVGAYKWMR